MHIVRNVLHKSSIYVKQEPKQDFCSVATCYVSHVLPTCYSVGWKTKGIIAFATFATCPPGLYQSWNYGGTTPTCHVHQIAIKFWRIVKTNNDHLQMARTLLRSLQIALSSNQPTSCLSQLSSIKTSSLENLTTRTTPLSWKNVSNVWHLLSSHAPHHYHGMLYFNVDVSYVNNVGRTWTHFINICIVNMERVQPLTR